MRARLHRASLSLSASTHKLRNHKMAQRTCGRQYQQATGPGCESKGDPRSPKSRELRGGESNATTPLRGADLASCQQTQTKQEADRMRRNQVKHVNGVERPPQPMLIPSPAQLQASTSDVRRAFKTSRRAKRDEESCCDQRRKLFIAERRCRRLRCTGARTPTRHRRVASYSALVFRPHQ